MAFELNRGKRAFSVNVDLLAFEGARIEMRKDASGRDECGIYIPCDINGLVEERSRVFAKYDAFRLIHGRATHMLFQMYPTSKRERYLAEGRLFPSGLYHNDRPSGFVFPKLNKSEK